MARHISRKELKKDEFRDTLEHGAEAIATHQRLAVIIGSAALAVVLVVFGWRFYSQRQTARASADLADAMKVYNARIRAANDPAGPDEVTYVDEKNKYADAAKKFTEVADKYSRTQPGHVAEYYAGLCLAQLDRNDEAERQLKKVESSGDQTLAPLAEFQLAQVYEKTNRGDQALKVYKTLSDKPPVFVPRAVVLLKMADYQSKTNPTEAVKLYNQVKTEFPDSPAAQAADQGLQLLPSAKS